MGVIAAYRRVLANGPLARLLFGEFVSSIGDWLYLVAMLVLIWDEAKDPVVLGLIGAARIVPYILLSVPAGIVADRFDRRLVLLITDVARGVIMLLIAAAVTLDMSVWVVVGLAIVATCFSAFFSPTIGAYLPSLVRDESELGPANSAWSSLDNLAFFIGPAFAALLLGLGTLSLAFVLNAVTFGVVALVLLRLPSGRAKVDPKPDSGAETKAEPRPGLRTVLAPVMRPLAGIAVLNVADGFVFGGLGVITVILAVDVFAVGEAGTGLLNSAVGVGGILGAVVAGALVLRRRLGPPLLAGALGLAAGIAVLGQVGNFALALAAMALASAGALLLEITATTLLQRIVPDSVRGRTLGAMETLTVTAYAAGAFVVPVLAASQPAAVLLASGAIMAVSGVIAVVLLGRYAVQEPVVDPILKRLVEVPLFAGLPPARIELALRAATVRNVTAGEQIIRQGDEADFFYVIGEGEVEVTQRSDGGEERTLRRMGPGEFFGEIGLLSGVPRTASVTAAKDGTLISLPGDAFLGLVSAGSGLTYRLLDLHRGVTAD
ncbi:MAG: MFS transporter [Chloroflexota bacterium]